MKDHDGSATALTLAVLLFAGTGGCTLSTSTIVPAPLSAAEQQLQVLEIAPVGTPRDEAIERLDDAGIVGSFGVTGARTTYYCDLWQRRDGTRWHLDVALLFDADARVWIARSGTSVAPTNRAVASDDGDGRGTTGRTPAGRSLPHNRTGRRHTALDED